MKLGIKTKLTLLTTAIAVFAGAGVGYIGYQVTSKELINGEARALQTTRQTLTAYIESLISNYKGHLANHASSPAAADALAAYSKAFIALPEEMKAGMEINMQRIQKANSALYDEAFAPLKARNAAWKRPAPPSGTEGALIQYALIASNPAGLGSKNRNTLPSEITTFTNLPKEAAEAFAKSAYGQATEKYQPFFDDLAKTLELDDVLLLNAEGDIIFSSAKRFDLGARASEAGGALSDMFNAAIAPEEGENKLAGRIVTSEIALHRHGFDAPTLFLGAPILDPEGKPAGVLAFAMNAGAFSRVLFGELTQSDSGTEAYLVGKDGLLRSESQHCTRLPDSAKREYFGANTLRLGDTAVLKLGIPKERADSAFKSYLPESYQNYLGDHVLGSAAKIGDGSLGLALIVESPLDQLLSPVHAMGRTMFGISAGAGFLAFLLAFFTGRAVTRPLIALKQTAAKVAAGNLKEKAPVLSGDEVGELAIQFNAMLAEINRQHEQTSRIMSTVKEALFLIDRSYVVQPQYSKETEDVFRSDFAGTNLLDFLSSYVSQKDIGTARDYIELLYSNRVKEKLIKQTNPLTEVELRMDDGQGGFKTKVVEFRFSRVVEDNEVQFVMVTCLDVTSRVLLARQMREAEKKASNQVELLFGIMHVDPPALREFLDVSQQHLERVDFLLRDEQNRVKDQETQECRTTRYRTLLSEIQRPIHLLKGNAAVLRIEFFEQRAHAFEDIIARVLAKSLPTGEDFIPVTTHLAEMLNSIGSTREVINRLSSMNAEFNKTARRTGDIATTFNMAEHLRRFTSDLADSIGKKVSVSIPQEIDDIIPRPHHNRVHEILTQLLRNAVVHGVEDPKLRMDRRKLPVGTVRVGLERLTTGYAVEVTDDGNGLDYEKIRERATSLGYRGTESWSIQQLTEVLFAPGFSTADQVTKNAGRGTGLDAVLDKVLSMGGIMEVAHKPGVECSFILTFEENPKN